MDVLCLRKRDTVPVPCWFVSKAPSRGVLDTTVLRLWATLSLLSLSPPPSKFCNDENNSVIRSAMDALSNSQKITFLTVTVLFLFAFLNLMLDTILLQLINHIFPVFKTGPVIVLTNANQLYCSQCSPVSYACYTSCLRWGWNALGTR